MNNNKLPANAKDTHSSLKPPSYLLTNTLNKFERNEALKQLASQISEVCSSSGRSDELMSFQLEKLPNILQLLAELAIEAKTSDIKKEEKNKILHVSAAMLRRMLHMPEASHYRVLGLDSKADSAQIVEHYQLLHELFWFDVTIDPQQKSRLQIFEAYTILSDSESRQQYDTNLMQHEQQIPRSEGGGLWRAAAVILPVILGLSAVMLYFEKFPGTEVASSLPKEKPDVYVTSTESYEPEKSPIVSIPIAAQPPVEQDEQQPPLSKSLPDNSSSELAIDTNPVETFLPEEVTEVIEIVSTESSELDDPRITEVQTDDNQRLLDFLQEPPIDMISSEVPHTTRPEVVHSKVKENHPAVPPSLPDNSTFKLTKTNPKPNSVVSITEAQVDTELLLPNLSPKPDLLGVTPVIVPQPKIPKKIEPVRIEEPAQQQRADLQRPPPASASKLAVATESTMVVIGSPNMEMSRLTREQVEKLFLGKMAMLPRWQGVEIFDQQDSNEVTHNFYKTVTNKTPMQAKAHWAKLQFGGITSQGLIHPPETLKNDQAIKERIAVSRSAIGYINRASLDGSVKVLLSLK